MPGKGRPFKRGNQAAKGHGKGRPKLEIISLAEKGAKAVLEADLAVLLKAEKNPRSVSKPELHRTKERLSRMCKGRIPTRIAVAGEEGGPPIPFAYVEVASAVARDGDEED